MKKKKDMMEEEQNMQKEEAMERQNEFTEAMKELKEEEPGVYASSEKKEEGGEAEDPVVALEDELARMKDKYLRLMAEFDNYKRRTSKEYDRLVESANERLMLDIIEVREGFERALGAADSNGDYSNFLDGMKLIYNKLDEVLCKNGLEVFTEAGDVFNPELHDAMLKTPHTEIPEDHIITIYEKGYKLKSRIIKHAKVIVSAGMPEGKEDREGKEDNEKYSEETPA